MTTTLNEAYGFALVPTPTSRQTQAFAKAMDHRLNTPAGLRSLSRRWSWAKQSAANI
jgi:hypothetical protein